MSRIGNYILQKKLAKLKRQKVSINIENAKTCGVIFDASQQSDYEAARKFINSLTEQNKKVSAFGFINRKDLQGFFQPQKNIEYFSRKNLNIFEIPNSPGLDEFIEKPFDLFFDLCINDFFAVKYISSLSHAKFKVGKFSEENSYFDFMIQIDKHETSDYFINQIIHYLSMINN